MSLLVSLPMRLSDLFMPPTEEKELCEVLCILRHQRPQVGPGKPAVTHPILALCDVAAQATAVSVASQLQVATVCGLVG